MAAAVDAAHAKKVSGCLPSSNQKWEFRTQLQQAMHVPASSLSFCLCLCLRSRQFDPSHVSLLSLSG